MTTEHPKSVKKALGEIRMLWLRVLTMKKMAQFADGIVAEHQDKFKRLEVSLGYSSGSLPGVLIIAHDIQDMREILPIIREMRRYGWKVKSHDDFPAAKRRTYYLENGKEKIKILALLSWDDGTTCRYVQVGVKKEPQYELQCDGETFAEENVEDHKVTG